MVAYWVPSSCKYLWPPTRRAGKYTWNAHTDRLCGDDFRDFVGLCSGEFGNRVKRWIALNEPHIFSSHGYATGDFAPGWCSEWLHSNCTGGNLAVEPYLVSHHELLLAHATAVKLYREKYQVVFFPVIRILFGTCVHIYECVFDNWKRAIRLTEPITSGHYPCSMRAIVGNRLPKFTKEQSLMLKGSFDFLRVNYYKANYARAVPPAKAQQTSDMTDALALQLSKCWDFLIRKIK